MIKFFQAILGVSTRSNSSVSAELSASSNSGSFVPPILRVAEEESINWKIRDVYDREWREVYQRYKNDSSAEATLILVLAKRLRTLEEYVARNS